MKPRLRIVRHASRCGGQWAWAKVGSTGELRVIGCVRHHAWTRVVRSVIWNGAGA